MMPENLAGLTGLAVGKKKTRRGKRRSASTSAHAEHLQHLAEMKRCAECQDNKGAKAAAFKFIKALPSDEPAMEFNVEEHGHLTDAAPPTAPAKGKLSPALVAYLKKKKG